MPRKVSRRKSTVRKSRKRSLPRRSRRKSPVRRSRRKSSTRRSRKRSKSKSRKKSRKPTRRRSKSVRRSRKFPNKGKTPRKSRKSRRKSRKPRKSVKKSKTKDENYECNCDYKYGKKRKYKYKCDCRYTTPKKSYKKKSKMSPAGTPRKVWKKKDTPKNRQIDELRELRSRELVGYGPTGVCPNPINRPRKYKVIIKNLAGEQIGGGEYWGDTLINTVRLDLIDNGVPKYEAKTGGKLYLGDMEVSNPQRSLRTMAIRTDKQNDEYLEFTFIIPPVNQIINQINSYMKNNLEQVRTALSAPDPQGLFIDYGEFQEGRPIYQGRKWKGNDTSLCNTILNPQTRYNVFSVPNGLFARFVTPHIRNIDNEPSTPEQMAFAYRIWNGEINEDNNEIFDQQNESAFLFYNDMWRQYRDLCDSVCKKQRFRAIVHKRLVEAGFSERYLQAANHLYVDPEFLCDHRWDN